MVAAPLMPKATAVWLVENTALSFDQVAVGVKNVGDPQPLILDSMQSGREQRYAF